MLEYFKEYFDYKALLICLGLVAVGLLSVYSATYDVGAAAAFEKQLVWTGIGLIALVTAAIFPLKTLQRISLPLYIVTLGVLLAILVLGHTVAGSKSGLVSPRDSAVSRRSSQRLQRCWPLLLFSPGQPFRFQTPGTSSSRSALSPCPWCSFLLSRILVRLSFFS